LIADRRERLHRLAIWPFRGVENFFLRTKLQRAPYQNGTMLCSSTLFSAN